MQWKSGRKGKTGVELRKKIKQLAIGVFDESEPNLSFSTERIELEVIEGKDVTGEFTIHSNNQKKLRGIVYTTHPRMECLTPQFDGEEVRVRYQFHSEGLLEGDIRKGEFVIVCDRGEYNLSFVVSVFRLYASSTIGKIRNLSDFTRLARESFTESFQLFYSARFPNIIKAEEEQERLLYTAIRKAPPSMQAVEAFLIGTGQKQPVTVQLDEAQKYFPGITASKKEQLLLKKDKWGYVTCEVTTDAAFIRLEKTTLSSDDFLGSTCFYEYYINAAALHAGKNFGHISFEFPGQTLSAEICVTTDCGKEGHIESGRHRNLRSRMELTQLYVAYRLKKIVTGVWAKTSIQLLDEMLDREPENDFYRLMKAQAFLVNRQKQEARWLLEDYKRFCTDRETPEWGYYLYLCTLMEREESYVNRTAGQIEQLFRRYPDNSLLFWILLFVKEEYSEHHARRLKAIERWVSAGADSPYFYLEAYYLFCQNPYLLSKLDGFELKILNWARKNGVITKEVATQVISLASAERVYHERLFQILTACYEVTGQEEAVSAICGYLIKGQKFSAAYHKWYELGVSMELRITNLYEAYLLSADTVTIEQAPKIIFMYFRYHNRLSYKQLALLYAFIIKNKKKYKDVYRNYRRTIEQFAMSQIEEGHIDENLTVIYQEMIPLGILDKELAERLSEILFMHRITFKTEYPFTRVIVVQKQWEAWQSVPILDGTAYFTAITGDYCILLQDANGYLYTDEKNYEVHLLLEAETYLNTAKKLAPDCLPYLVFGFEKKQKEKKFEAEDTEELRVLLSEENVSQEWKVHLLPDFVRCLAEKGLNAQTESLLQYVNDRRMASEERRFLAEQLIENHFFEQAYEMLGIYGCDLVGSSYCVAVCSYGITEENFEEDEYLIKLADYTFRIGKYNEVILRYLCRYYNGPTKHMAEVWKAAGAFEIDAGDLEERILTQMLYSTDYIEQADEIYKSYCRHGGSELVCMAYLTYFSRLYFCKDAVVGADIFSQTEYRRMMHQELNDVQNFALLKYYASLETRTELQYHIADELLLKYTCLGIWFGFYKKLDERLAEKYHLNDKFFAEYHTKPGTRVFISYCGNDGVYRTEQMTEAYDGIFVKPFILFLGERISYYITEKNEKREQSITYSGELENQDGYAVQGSSRYGMLNTMFSQAALQEGGALKENMKEYHRKKCMTEALFKILE